MLEMTSRERIMAAINHEEVDRVPIDFWGVGEITQKLMKHFGVKDWVKLSPLMGIDKIINAVPVPKNGLSYWDTWGIKNKKIKLSDDIGEYEEPESHPIAGYETIEEIEVNYKFPTTDMWEYSTIEEQCKNAEGFAIEAGYTSLTFMYEMIRGTEQMLIDFIAEPDLARYILDKLQEFHYAHMKKILEAGNGRIDITQVTDDLGSQYNLMFSPDMIDTYLREYYEKNIALVKQYGSHVFHHDDGAMTSALPWLTKRGIEILNPLQWHLPGWELEKIKADYKKKLCFHGGIDNQYVLPFGTDEELEKEVKYCIDVLFSDKTGYILAPCHNVQSNTSVEKVLKMIEYAKKHGKF